MAARALPRKYPTLSLQEVRAILKARTFVLANTAGSHEQWAGEWDGKPRIVTVDSHHQDFSVGILQSMIRQSGMTREQFYGSTPRTAKKI